MHPSLLTDIVTTLRAMESPEAGEWLALTRTPDALTREGAPGHFTASALPISPDASQVCLVLHRRMDLWVQPGGHLEFGDTSIAGAAAREMEEETGLQGRVDPRPVLLSRHPAPCRPETWHYDIQFRAVVPVIFLRPRTWRRMRAAALDLPRLMIIAMAYLPAFPTLRRICSPW